MAAPTSRWTKTSAAPADAADCRISRIEVVRKPVEL
jgi:hypothetical protein